MTKKSRSRPREHPPLRGQPPPPPLHETKERGKIKSIMKRLVHIKRVIEDLMSDRIAKYSNRRQKSENNGI